MPRLQALRMLPDEDGLGPIHLPQEPFPRQLSEITIPLSPFLSVPIALPVSMTTEEWDRMIRFLAIIRGGFVED